MAHSSKEISSLLEETIVTAEFQKISLMYKDLILQRLDGLYLYFVKRHTWSYVKLKRVDLAEKDLMTCKDIIFYFFTELHEAYQFYFIWSSYEAWMDFYTSSHYTNKDFHQEVASSSLMPQDNPLRKLNKKDRWQRILEFFPFGIGWQNRPTKPATWSNRHSHPSRLYFEDIVKDSQDIPERDMEQLRKDCLAVFTTLPAAVKAGYTKKAQDTQESQDKHNEWILEDASLMTIKHPLGKFRPSYDCGTKATMFNHDLLYGKHASFKGKLIEHIRILVPDSIRRQTIQKHVNSYKDGK